MSDEQEVKKEPEIDEAHFPVVLVTKERCGVGFHVDLPGYVIIVVPGHQIGLAFSVDTGDAMWLHDMLCGAIEQLDGGSEKTEPEQEKIKWN